MLGKNQATEWGRYNVRVNTICPGFVKTKLSEMFISDEKNKQALLKNTALRKLGKPEDFAGLAVYLASDASSFMTGSTIVQDGGLMLAPLVPVDFG